MNGGHITRSHMRICKRLPIFEVYSEGTNDDNFIFTDLEASQKFLVPFHVDRLLLGPDFLYSSDENEDLLADFIDEDSPLPSRVSNPTLKGSTSSRNWKHEEIEDLTGSCVSLLRWMDKYARLIQKLETISLEFFKGICQLFEVYFYFVFKTFVQCYRSPRIIWDPGIILGFSWFS